MTNHVWLECLKLIFYFMKLEHKESLMFTLPNNAYITYLFIIKKRKYKVVHKFFSVVLMLGTGIRQGLSNWSFFKFLNLASLHTSRNKNPGTSHWRYRYKIGRHCETGKRMAAAKERIRERKIGSRFRSWSAAILLR